MVEATQVVLPARPKTILCIAAALYVPPGEHVPVEPVTLVEVHMRSKAGIAAPGIAPDSVPFKVFKSSETGSETAARGPHAGWAG